MYFNVYSDLGSSIEGYLIPDGFASKPSICIKSGGETFGPIACDVFLEGPLKHKHHATGVVGFKIDDSKIPQLGARMDVEIADFESGFCFYRRFQEQIHVRKRVFRLETQFIPHVECDRSLSSRFQFHAGSVERFGSETVRQTLEIAGQHSTYVSGRVMFKNVKQYLSPDTIQIASLRDPFYELGVRLWSLGAHKRRGMPFISERDAILFEPAMRYFCDTDFSRIEEIGRKVRNAAKDVLSIFESPFTSQLVATSPNEKIGYEGISAALDELSQFTFVNIGEHESTIGQEISDVIGLESGSVSFSTIREPFITVAEHLKEIKVLEQVLETDLILFHFLEKAKKRSETIAI